MQVLILKNSQVSGDIGVLQKMKMRRLDLFESHVNGSIEALQLDQLELLNLGGTEVSGGDGSVDGQTALLRFRKLSSLGGTRFSLILGPQVTSQFSNKLASSKTLTCLERRFTVISLASGAARTCAGSIFLRLGYSVTLKSFKAPKNCRNCWRGAQSWRVTSKS